MKSDRFLQVEKDVDLIFATAIGAVCAVAFLFTLALAVGG